MTSFPNGNPRKPPNPYSVKPNNKKFPLRFSGIAPCGIGPLISVILKENDFIHFKEALMKRKEPSGLIAKWKGTFSKGEVRTLETVKAAKQAEGLSNVPSLTLIKKRPITFQLSRLENPLDFELMSFVVKACDKKGDRPFMAVVHVEQSKTGSRIIASDGIRLHAAEISKRIKSGNYKPLVSKDAIALGEAEKEINYPEWLKVIPKNAEKLGVIDLEKSGLGKVREETAKFSIAFNSFVKQTGETINLLYLEDLPKKEWTVYSQDGGIKKVIMLKQQNGKTGEEESKYPVAVIMPLDQAA
jgi:hypothetical protein